VTTNPGTRSLASRVWPWVRAVGPLRVTLIVVAIVAFGYLWLQLRGRFPEATVWQVPLVIELLILSLPWRVVSTGTVLRFFLLGFGPVFLAAVATQSLLAASPIDGWLHGVSSSFERSGVGSLGSLRATVYAPITEELWKIVPLLAVLAWGRSRLWHEGGPLDFAIIAAATGAGLGMAEDLFVLSSLGWSVPESPLLGLGAGNAWVAFVVNPLNSTPINVSGFDLGYQGLVSVLDPSVRAPDGQAVWPGHGIMPMAFGLVLGWVAMVRRRAGTILVYLVPLAVLAWSIWDHFVANWYRSRTCDGVDEPTLCSLAHLDLNGAIYPLAAIALWVLATLASQRVLRRHRRADPATRLSRADLSTAAYREGGPTWPIRFAGDLLRFIRARNRVAYAWPSTDPAVAPDRAEPTESVVNAWVEAGSLAWRLRGRPQPGAGDPPGV